MGKRSNCWCRKTKAKKAGFVCAPVQTVSVACAAPAAAGCEQSAANVTQNATGGAGGSATANAPLFGGSAGQTVKQKIRQRNLAAQIGIATATDTGNNTEVENEQNQDPAQSNAAAESSEQSQSESDGSTYACAWGGDGGKAKNFNIQAQIIKQRQICNSPGGAIIKVLGGDLIGDGAAPVLAGLSSSLPTAMGNFGQALASGMEALSKALIVREESKAKSISLNGGKIVVGKGGSSEVSK